MFFPLEVLEMHIYQCRERYQSYGNVQEHGEYDSVNFVRMT